MPNYFPTLRVIEYNTTGLGKLALQQDTQIVTSTAGSVIPVDAQDASVSNPESASDASDSSMRNAKSNFEIPKPPSSASPPGPAYSNQPLTLLGYTQYFANLTRINDEVAVGGEKNARLDFEVEYNTADDVYQMKDLTVRSFFELATRIGEEGDISASKKRKVNLAWRAFVERAFAGFVNVDELAGDAVVV